jgi:hypothetical protein
MKWEIDKNFSQASHGKNLWFTKIFKLIKSRYFVKSETERQKDQSGCPQKSDKH